MTQPIDRAYVDIEANTQDFSRDLKRDVEEAYDKVDRQTQLLSKKITKSFDAAGREIKRTFTSVAKDGKVTTTVVEDAFDEMGDKIKRTFKFVSKEGVAAEELIAVVAHEAADSAADSFERMGHRIERAFHGAARTAARETAKMAAEAELATSAVSRNTGLLNTIFGKLGETIVSLGSSLVSLGASAPSPAGLVTILATITAIAALTGPIIVLGAALAQLIGLVGPLPAILGSLIAVVLPLVFAFQGLGDAIAAVNKGDPKKIAEAMQKLSPAAREVVKEITGLNKVFDAFRKNIQQAFFKPIVGDIGETVRILLPSLQKSIGKVATSLGQVVENFLAWAQQTPTLKIFNNLFTATSQIIDKLNVPFVELINTFFELVNAGLPFVKRFADAFGGLLTKFNNFVSKSIKSGGFNTFVEDAIKTTKELFGLIGSLGNLIGAIFGGRAQEGHDFIKTLTDGVNALADFFRSADGKRSIDDLVGMIKGTIAVFKVLWEITKFLNAAFHKLFDIIGAVGSAVGDFFGAMGDFFSSIGSAIATGFSAAVDFFRSLPGKILDFLKSLPGMIIGFFETMFDNLMKAIGVAIGLVIFNFTKLPGLIVDAVKALPELLGDIISAAWNFAEQKTIQGVVAVVDFVKSLPGRILSLAKTVGSAISDFFSQVFTGGKRKAGDAVDAIIGFVKNLPSKLTAFVKNVGGQIADVIKNMLNRAINKINEGIGKVDDVLPGSLPRIPNLADGAIVKAKPGGTIARIAEAGQDEIVGPLKDVAKLFQGTGGTTITFDAGAVQVTFEGAVPTAAEAFQTGQAVGQGIIAVLTQRNVRTNVRTL